MKRLHLMKDASPEFDAHPQASLVGGPGQRHTPRQVRLAAAERDLVGRHPPDAVRAAGLARRLGVHMDCI